MQALYRLAVGGTAVGTGINAPPDFGEMVSLEIARLTGGAFCRFAPGAAHELAELLRAAAAYAAGGLKALADLKAQSAGVAKLIEQLK